MSETLAARGFTLAANQMVAMRDGVRLATDVYAPAGAEPGGPILVTRTPYGKDEAARRYGFAQFFAAHGYTVVQQDCRGCFNSQGEVDFLAPEAEDGADTLEWIAAQPWGGGEVGTFGVSWSGWTQTAAAGLGPRRLKTMVPSMSGADGWSSSIRHGGALELRWIAWAFWHSAQNLQAELGKTNEIERALIRPQKRFSDWLETWPIQPGETQLRLTPAYERWVMELLRREERDAWWDSPSLHPARHRPRFPGCSALYLGGWYDSYTRASVENFTDHVRSGAGKAQLLMGPWTHGIDTVEQAFSGGVAFSPDAALASYKALLLAWFDRELKGEGPGVQAQPIRLYVMGGGEARLDGAGRLLHGGSWRDETSWPLPRTQFRRLFLHADGGLCERAPGADETRAFDYDPADPAPSLGGNVSSHLDLRADAPEPAEFHRLLVIDRTVPIVTAGGFDQAPLARRTDILVFQSEPLAADLEITGPIEVHLWVQTSAADTDFTAKLIDVYPPSAALPAGFALNLSDSIVRLRFRALDGKARPLAPGEVAPVAITLYPVSNRFCAGHRIRLDISSANFPRFDFNPNTGAPAHVRGERIVARNTVHCGPARPSHIVLPVIPA